MQKLSLSPTWNDILAPEFTKPYFAQIRQTLVDDTNAGYTIYPPLSHVFYAFELTDFDAIQVVILGQDPYHGSGQAMGMSFSVPDGVALPPSLQNIYKELGVHRESGNLESWARQ